MLTVYDAPQRHDSNGKWSWLFWNELPNSKGATVPKKLLVYEIYYRGDEQRRSRCMSSRYCRGRSRSRAI